MLGRLSEPPIRYIVRTLLELPRLLDQGFVRVQGYGASFPRPRPCAGRTHRIRSAHVGIKLEYLSLVAPASAVLQFSPWRQGATFLARWASARPGLQIDGEVFFGKVRPVGPMWHASNELSPGLSKSAARGAVAVRTIANCLLNLYPCVLFRLLTNSNA